MKLHLPKVLFAAVMAAACATQTAFGLTGWVPNDLYGAAYFIDNENAQTIDATGWTQQTYKISPDASGLSQILINSFKVKDGDTVSIGVNGWHSDYSTGTYKINSLVLESGEATLNFTNCTTINIVDSSGDGTVTISKEDNDSINLNGRLSYKMDKLRLVGSNAVITSNFTATGESNNRQSGIYQGGSNGGTITFGDGANGAVASVQRIEIGDFQSGSAESKLNVKANYTLKVTGAATTENGGDVGVLQSDSLVIGSWNAATVVNIEGQLFAKDAGFGTGIKGGELNIKTGGVVAVKGIYRVNGDASSLSLNMQEGSKLILGSLGINSGIKASAFSSDLQGCTIASYAKNTSILQALTISGEVTIDTRLYDFAVDGNSIAVGTETSSITISGAMSGNGKLVKTGAGTLTLSGANTYSGGTTVDNGTLVVQGEGSLGTGDVTVKNGGTLAYNGGENSLTNVTLDAGTTLRVQDGTLEISGNGTSGTGGIIVEGGTLVARSAGALGTEGSISITGGTLQIGAAVNLGKHLTQTGGSISVTDGNSLTIGTATIGNGATLNAMGTLTTTGTLTFNGLYSGTSTALQTSGKTAQIIFGADATIDIAHLTSTNNDLNRDGFVSASYRVTGEDVFASITGTTIKLVYGTKDYGAGTWSGGVVTVGDALYNVVSRKSYTDDYTTEAQEAGRTAAGIMVQSTGTFVADNKEQELSITGSGTLEAAWEGRAQAGDKISAAAKMFVGSVVVKSGTSWLIGNDYTFSSVTVEDGGQFGLDGTYTGNITISGDGLAHTTEPDKSDWRGALKFGDGGTLDGNVTIAGEKGSLSTWGVHVGNISGNITSGQEGGSVLEIMNGNGSGANRINLSGDLSGVKEVKTNGGTLSIAGEISNYGECFTKSGAGTLELAGNHTLTDDTIQIEAGRLLASQLTITGTTIKTGEDAAVQVTSALTASGTNSIGNLELKENITLTTNDNAALTVNKFSLHNEAAAGQELALAGRGTLTIAGESQLKNLALKGTDLVVKANTTIGGVLITRSGSGDSTVTVQSGATLSMSSFSSPWGIATLRVDGTLDCTGSFVISSGGMVNNITGGGVINVGSLHVQNAATRADFSNVTLNLGDGGIGSSTAAGQGNCPIWFGNMTVGVREGTTQWSTELNTISLEGTGTGTKFAPGEKKSITISGAMSGNGKLVKTGAGTLTLGGANTYSGGTTVEGGTLVADAAGALGTEGSISITGGTLQVGAAVDLGDRLTQTGGSISVTAEGTLTLGTATINGLSGAGALQVKSGKTVTVAGSIGNTTLEEGSSLKVTSGNCFTTGGEKITQLESGTNTTITGTGIVSVATGNITYNNALIDVTTAGTTAINATLSSSKVVNSNDEAEVEVSAASLADGTSSIEAAEGDITITGDAGNVGVQNLAVAADKKVSVGDDGTGTATVSGTATLQNGSTVSGNVTIGNDGKLVISGTGFTADGFGAMVEGTLTANATAVSLAPENKIDVSGIKATTTYVLATAQNMAITGNFTATDFYTGTLADGMTAAVSVVQPTSTASYALDRTTASQLVLTLTAAADPNAPVTLTATAVGTSYSDGTLNINVNPTDLTQYNGKNLAVKVDSEAWKSIVAAMSGVDGGVYNFATITLNNTTLNNFGTVSFNGYAGTDTKGEYFVAYIPEPATATLSLLALAALAARRRRK